MKKKLSYLIPILLLLARSVIAGMLTPTDSLDNFKNGRENFRTYCSSCHGVHKEIMGPMLASIPKKRTQEWLVRFIRNSQQVIASGDAYANFLYRQYNQNVMPSFKQLSDEEIYNILYYIEQESINPREETQRFGDVDAEGNSVIVKGKQIFQNQCSPCHFIDKENTSQGPALGSVARRRPKGWLHPFIKNSQRVIQSGDPYAVYLFNSFNRRVMVPMEFLTDDDIESILDYITFASASSHAEAGVNGRTIDTYPDTRTALTNIPPLSHETQPFFKILFIVVTSLATIVYAYLITKLFQYLQKEKTSK